MAGLTPPAIAGDHGFIMAVKKVQPGKGAPLHAHPKAEVLVVLSGECSVFWGDNGENEVVLEKWDTMSFPAGTREGFKNLGDQEANLLVLLSGPEVGEVTFAKR